MNFHPRNKYQGFYNFEKLILREPKLKNFIKTNDHGNPSISFADDNAVKLLNKALVADQYGVMNWDFPDSFLCPSVPGRAEYIHLIADLLARYHDGKIPYGKEVNGVDIGTGAGVIYPIIGKVEYGWSYVASEVDKSSLAFAQKVLFSNKDVLDNIEIVHQKDGKSIFGGVLQEDKFYDFTMCNPPFYRSKEEAVEESKRKYKRLSGEKTGGYTLKGSASELTFPGGEWGFLRKMVMESKEYAEEVYWFTSLVSKKDNMKQLYSLLRKVRATKVETIPFNLKNKNSRIIAWTFASKAKRKALQNRTFE